MAKRKRRPAAAETEKPPTKPEWYDSMDAAGKAAYDATDWGAEEPDCCMDENETMAAPAHVPSRKAPKASR